MSAIPHEVWSTIDYFFYCYSRTPGLAGWVLQRSGYPDPGSVGEQDAKIMWEFSTLENEFLHIQSEASEEGQRAKELEKTHRNMQRGGAGVSS